MKLHITLTALATTGMRALGNSDDGLTIGEIVAHIPHDPSAFVVYALLLGAVAFVWRAGRSSG